MHRYIDYHCMLCGFVMETHMGDGYLRSGSFTCYRCGAEMTLNWSPDPIRLLSHALRDIKAPIIKVA